MQARATYGWLTGTPAAPAGPSPSTAKQPGRPWQQRGQQHLPAAGCSTWRQRWSGRPLAACCWQPQTKRWQSCSSEQPCCSSRASQVGCCRLLCCRHLGPAGDNVTRGAAAAAIRGCAAEGSRAADAGAGAAAAPWLAGPAGEERRADCEPRALLLLLISAAAADYDICC